MSNVKVDIGSVSHVVPKAAIDIVQDECAGAYKTLLGRSGQARKCWVGWTCHRQ